MSKLQRDIVRRHGLVSVGVVLLTILFFFGYLWRSPAPSGFVEMAWIAAIYWSTQLFFLYWVWSGGSAKYADPSMTMPFLLLGVTYISAGLYIAPVNRDVVLLYYLTAIPYGVFQLTWQKFLWLTAYIMFTYIGVMIFTVLSSDSSMVWTWPGEMVIATALLFSLLSFSLLGREMTVLRQAYRQKNHELRSALAQIEELAVTDELTGLFNRRYLLAELGKVQARAEREKMEFSVAFIDIDFFKKINDTHGHSIGDRVLAELAGVLKESVREVDTVARYGGEEFVIVFNALNLEQGKQILERINETIISRSFSEIQIRLGISAGITQYIPKETIDQLLFRADSLLYQAKHSGRGQIIAAKELGQI